MGGLDLDTQRRLSAPALFSYCVYAIPLTAITVATTSFIPPFYSEVHGVSLAAIGLMLLILRVFDAVTDPLMGIAIDRSPFRQQHKPWILIAFPVFIASIGLLFIPVPALVGNAYFFIAGFFVYVAYTVALVSHQAWGAALAPDPRSVSRLFGFREVAVIVGILGTFFVAAIAEHTSGGGLDVKARAAGIFILTALVISTLVTFFFAPDDRRTLMADHTSFSNQRRFLLERDFVLLCIANVCLSFAWVGYSVIGYFIAEYVFNMGSRYALGLALYFVAAGFGMTIWMWLAARVGDRVTLLVSVLYAAGTFLMLFVWAEIGTPLAYFASVVLHGIAFGAGPYLVRAMVGTRANEFERSSGHNVRGVAYSVMTFFDKVGTGLAAGIVLQLVVWLGFDPASETASQHANVVLAVGVLAPVAAFLAMAGLLHLISKSRKGHPARH
jgi:Na+/melibiose symporter-like transporter